MTPTTNGPIRLTPVTIPTPDEVARQQSVTVNWQVRRWVFEAIVGGHLRRSLYDGWSLIYWTGEMWVIRPGDGAVGWQAGPDDFYLGQVLCRNGEIEEILFDSPEMEDP